MLLSRFLVPFLIPIGVFITAMTVTVSNDQGTLQFVMAVIGLGILLVGMLNPYLTVGKIVISDTGIMSDHGFVDVSELNSIHYALCKPRRRTVMQFNFSFFLSGFGSYLVLHGAGRPPLKMYFFLSDLQEERALKALFVQLTERHDIDVQEMPFEPPRFPYWSDFVEKERE